MASRGAEVRAIAGDRIGISFALGAGQHLVVGRHTRADVVLPTDPDLSLRHLLVVPEAGSAPRLRLVDLRAALPMYAA